FSAALPLSVRQFHTLMPLDDAAGTRHTRRRSASQCVCAPDASKKLSMFGHATHLYKCISSLDGAAYAMRRIEGFRLQSEMGLAPVELWKRVQHPNIAALHQVFVTKEFDNQNSLCFVYDYFPNAVTLAQRYLPSAAPQAPILALPEATLWSFVLQM